MLKKVSLAAAELTTASEKNKKPQILHISFPLNNFPGRMFEAENYGKNFCSPVKTVSVRRGNHSTTKVKTGFQTATCISIEHSRLYHNPVYSPDPQHSHRKPYESPWL